MVDSKHPRNPQSSWPIDPKATVPPAGAAKPPASADKPAEPGRIVHDSRGNAVWNWVKDTSRAALDSTSAMLKRLDVPGLKMEGEEDKDELSIKPDRDTGGGYDPYNVRKPVSKSKPPGGK